jgi:predicted transcriptional regulator
MRLTKAEEQIMQMLWEMEEGIVKEIRLRFEEPRPARNTVSTVVRILERKGIYRTQGFGDKHIYYPLVSKREYSKSQLFGLMENYFNNSFPALASFFASEKDMSIKDLEALLEDTRQEMKKTKKKKTRK